MRAMAAVLEKARSTQDATSVAAANQARLEKQRLAANKHNERRPELAMLHVSPGGGGGASTPATPTAEGSAPSTPSAAEADSRPSFYINAELNNTSSAGLTALHMAVLAGSEECVLILLTERVDTGVRDRLGR